MKQQKRQISDPGRRYVGDQLDEDLRRFIRTADADTALQSERQLTRDYGVCIGTVRRVLQTLVDEGLIYKVHGKGNFVKASDRSTKRKIIFADAWSSGFHPFFSRKLDGIIDEAEKRGFFLQVCSIHYRHEKERGMLLPMASAEDVAGLIYPYNNVGFLSEIRKRNPSLPIVSDQSSLDFDLTAEVNIDFCQFGKLAAAYLQEQQVTRPLIVINNEDVVAGFRQQWADPASLKSIVAVSLDDMGELCGQLASSRFDGLCFTDDMIAAEVLLAHREVLPASLPDHAIISCRNLGNDRLPGTIATLDVDGYAVGSLVVHVLCSLMDHPYQSKTRTLYTPTLRQAKQEHG